MTKFKFPTWVKWLIKSIIKEEFYEEISGDLSEHFANKTIDKNYFFALFWLFTQIPLLIRRSLLKPISNPNYLSLLMVNTHLKISFRNLWKFKSYSFINLFGLTFGAAAAIILFLAAEFENSYDKFLPNYEQIYRVGENSPQIGNYYQTRTPLAQAFKEAFPEVIATTRFFYFGGWIESQKQSLVLDLYLVDSDFPNIFEYEVLEGNLHKALAEKKQIALTASKAYELFGFESALGKTVTRYPDKIVYQIAAIIADPPANSSLQFHGLTAWKNGPSYLNLNEAGNWYNTFMNVYVKLGKNANPDQLLAKTTPFIQSNFLPAGNQSKIILLPIAKLHSEISQNDQLITLLTIIAFSILTIAGFNFINLNTAQLLVRLKEVGIRKVLGANRQQIISLYVFESFIITMLALSVAIILVFSSIPYIKELFEIDLNVVWTNQYTTLPIILISGTLYGFFTGLLPAIMISKTQIINSIKGSFKNNSSKQLTQKGLIVFQFIAFTFLITSTLIIWKQIDFMKNHELNFDSKNTIIINSNTDNFKNKKNITNKLLHIKSKLNNHIQVAGASFSRTVPGKYWENYNDFIDERFPDKKVRLRQATVDPDYFKTMAIQFIEGGDLRKQKYRQNEVDYAVLNQSAMNEFGWTNLDEKVIKEDSGIRKIKILGVTEDFHYQGLNQKIEPFIHWVNDSLVNSTLSIRIQNPEEETANPHDIIKLLKKDWNDLNPFEPLSFEFLDDSFNSQYKQQEKLGYLVGFFSFVAIIIASLGLYSLSAFMIRRRKKEIGIRKILGASIIQLYLLLSKSFMALAFIALLFSIPIINTVAGYFLSEFAYPVTLGWEIYLSAAVFSAIIASFSISFKIIKTSLSNPVHEIKDE